MKIAVFLGFAVLAGSAHAAALTPQQIRSIDSAATDTLRLTGVPAANLAIVVDGKIAYAHAYGLAQINPKRPAATDMPSSIGSVSKQFTAALILLLQQDGKLSLDDKVGKYLPELTRANDVTIRQLLTHTSGYRDLAPEDYFVPGWGTPTTPMAVIDDWGKKPLDFEPGTQWQYSNTGFAIAAMIAEKAGGAPFFTQLKTRILDKLGMRHTSDYASFGAPKGGLTGYQRYGFGPPRPAPLDTAGWSYGSGGLAMTPSDLALWDISLMNRSVLAPASYDAMETEQKLKNGEGTGYGLGVELATFSGHRVVYHSGEETGFVTQNTVFPDDKIAIAVLTNQDASRAASVIAREIALSVFHIAPDAPKDPKLALVLSTLNGLAAGHVDMSRFNDNLRGYFRPVVLQDYQTSLAPFGPPLGVRERQHEDRGGMVFHICNVTYPAKDVTVTTYELKDGSLDQFLIEP